MEAALEKPSAKKAAAAAAEERMNGADVQDDGGAASVDFNLEPAAESDDECPEDPKTEPETDTESLGEYPSVVVQPHTSGEHVGQKGGEVSSGGKQAPVNEDCKLQ